MNLQKRVDTPWVQKLQAHFRRKRFTLVEKIIRRELQSKSEISVLDAGGRIGYWAMLPTDLRSRVNLTLLNYGSELAAYAVEEYDGLRVENVSGNACNMPQYADRHFDIAHSNSVIEHVGGYVNMVAFANEVRRVASVYYIQTPNYWFPIDPHYAVPFIHWLPDALKLRILSQFKVGIGLRANVCEAMEQVDSCRMISRWMLRQLFGDAHFYRERFLGLLTKSLIATGPKSRLAPPQ